MKLVESQLNSSNFSEIIEYSDTVSPICISDEKVELSGWGYIAGWGITKEKGFQSHELLEATLPIFDTNKCNMRYGGKIDAETQFCAGYSKLKSENTSNYNVNIFVF